MPLGQCLAQMPRSIRASAPRKLLRAVVARLLGGWKS